MTRLFKNWKSLYKGVLFALAFIMAFTFVPMNAIELLAKAMTETEALAKYNTITLDAKAESTVTKGAQYPIKKATLKGKDAASGFTVGSEATENITASDVKVTYKGTDDTEQVTKYVYDAGQEGHKDATIYGYFTPSRVGTYVITYSFTNKEGKVFEYNYEVNSTLSKATFNFYDLREVDGKYEVNGNLPKIYDTKLIDSLPDHNGEITLPLPVIKGAKGKNMDVKFVTNENEITSVGDYVLIDVVGSDYVKIEQSQDEKHYVIKESSLQDDEGNFVAGTYTITYTLYTKQEGADKQFIGSIDKTFEVVTDGYYYTNADKTKSDYTLKTEWATSAPTTAVTKAKQGLPKVVGKTDSTNSPANEEVPVSYSITIQRKDGNTYKNVSEDPSDFTQGGNLVVEDDNYYFVPQQDGDYRIQYEITDFYQHTVDVTTTRFVIDNVKDKESPTVYIYDANDTYKYEKDENGDIVKDVYGNNVYASAKSKLKSVTSYNNIIIYAVGATDNAQKEQDIELRRLILDNVSVVRFDTTDYANYNLIIQFDGSYQNLISQNYSLKHDMLNEPEAEYKITTEDLITDEDGKDYKAETVEKIKKWLAYRNYLIVTNSLETVPDGSEEGKKFEYGADVTTDEQKIAALQEAGYAYVNYDHKFTNVFSSDSESTTQRTTSYTIRYEARDTYAKENDKPSRESYTMKLADVTYKDEIAPTIDEGPKNLYPAYMPTDVIKFSTSDIKESDASDTSERLDVVVAFRYLTGDNPIEQNGAGDVTLEFTPREDVNGQTDAHKGQPQRTPSKGWKVLKANNNEYEIDLSTKPELANSVQILIYTVDDYGNIGQWNKTILINNVDDTEAPKLISVDDPSAAAEKTFKQGDKIVLPTIKYSDDRVSDMNAEVYVYNTQKSGEKTTTHTLSSQGMNAYARASRNIYTVEAGSFIASYSGDYQVVVIVKDGGGHAHATYFNYTVEPKIRVEDVKIDNIYETTINRRVTEEGNDDGIYRIVRPTLSLPNVEGYTFAGISKLDDANTATDFEVEVTSEGRYEKTDDFLRGLDATTYKLQYTVYLASFKTENDKNVTLDESGHVKFNDTKGYFVYVNKDGSLGANTKVDGTGEEYKSSDNKTIEEKFGIQGYARVSDTVTINYSAADAPIVMVDLGGIKASYQKENKDSTQTIVLPEISASTAKGQTLDTYESRVEIEITKSGVTTNLTTIRMKDWKNTNTGYNAERQVREYTLKDDGTYTITYYAVAEGNIDAQGKLVKTIQYGDTVSPKLNLNVKNGFLTSTDGKTRNPNEFKLNDQLVLHKEKLEYSDNKTPTEELKVEITVTLGGQKQTNLNEEAGGYLYDLTTAGDYVVTVTVTDGAERSTKESITITVAPEGSEATITYETIGTILIVVSAVILAGVIGYFIYSKVKLDKETKKIK